jgi:hypothetical protein
MEKIILLSCLAAFLIEATAGLDRELWGTLAHHEKDIERVAARRVLHEEEEQEQGEEHTRQERKVESSGTEQIEGRFFLQDKLCALGLAEVPLQNTV